MSIARNAFLAASLALGALCGDQTEEFTKAALEAVPKKEAENWVKRVLGTTVQMFRRLFVSTGKA